MLDLGNGSAKEGHAAKPIVTVLRDAITDLNDSLAVNRKGLLPFLNNW